MAFIRVEKWGDSWRLLKFKTAPALDSVPAPSDVTFQEPENLDEGDFWEERWQREEDESNPDSPENKARFDSSIARARSRIRELAMCNDWQYFVTLTMSPEKCDRFDLKQWRHDLSVWIGNYNKKYFAHLLYLLIPEQHKDGAWHAHGLFAGVAPGSVVQNMHNYLDLPYYANRFGFINLAPIKDKKRVAGYITKYVSKDQQATAKALDRSAHLFYHSRGLAGKMVVWQGSGDFAPDWENDFVGVKFTDSTTEIIDIMTEEKQK